MTFRQFTNSPNSLPDIWKFQGSSNSLLDIWIFLQPSTDRKTLEKPMNFYSLLEKNDTCNILVGKKKILSLYSDATTGVFFIWFICNFFKTKKCYFLTKIHGVSVSIPHCPMDYCILHYLKINSGLGYMFFQKLDRKFSLPIKQHDHIFLTWFICNFFTKKKKLPLLIL